MKHVCIHRTTISKEASFSENHTLSQWTGEGRLNFCDNDNPPNVILTNLADLFGRYIPDKKETHTIKFINYSEKPQVL